MNQLSTLKPRFKGPSGKKVLLRSTDSNLQWMLEGDVNWQNLVALDDLAPNKMLKTGGVFTGNVQFKNVIETLSNVNVFSNTAYIDMAQGNVFLLELTENVSVLEIANIPTGDVIAFTLLVRQDATTAKTLTWSGSNIPILWPNNATPLVTSELAKTDVFSFLTIDAGASFFGFTSGQAY